MVVVVSLSLVLQREYLLHGRAIEDNLKIHFARARDEERQQQTIL
jgi:hypothetical protein